MTEDFETMKAHAQIEGWDVMFRWNKWWAVGPGGMLMVASKANCADDVWHSIIRRINRDD